MIIIIIKKLDVRLIFSDFPIAGLELLVLDCPLVPPWRPQKTQLTGTHCCSVDSFSSADRRLRNAASRPSFTMHRSK